MNHLSDAHKFSRQAVDCLRAIGDYVFHNPLHTVPWGGRPHVLGRRYILQKYLTNEDLLQAYWVEETARRTDPQWRNTEPGLSHLSKLLRERSGGLWQQEQAEYQKKTPSQGEYMEMAWGDESRRASAHYRKDKALRRRAMFELVRSSGAKQS